VNFRKTKRYPILFSQSSTFSFHSEGTGEDLALKEEMCHFRDSSMILSTFQPSFSHFCMTQQTSNVTGAFFQASRSPKRMIPWG